MIFNTLTTVYRFRNTFEIRIFCVFQVFFDLEIDGKREGRIAIGLFGQDVPKTVKNFYELATHQKVGLLKNNL